MCIDVMNWIDAMGWEFHVEDVGSIPNLGIHCTVITYIIIIKHKHEKTKTSIRAVPLSFAYISY